MAKSVGPKKNPAPKVRKPDRGPEPVDNSVPVNQFHIKRRDLLGEKPPEKKEAPKKIAPGSRIRPALRDDCFREPSANPRTKEPVQEEPEPEIPYRVTMRQQPQEIPPPTKVTVASKHRKPRPSGYPPAKRKPIDHTKKAPEAQTPEPEEPPTPEPPEPEEESVVDDTPLAVPAQEPKKLLPTTDPMHDLLAVELGNLGSPSARSRRAIACLVMPHHEVAAAHRVIGWLRINGYAIDLIDRRSGKEPEDRFDFTTLPGILEIQLTDNPPTGYDMGIVIGSHPGSFNDVQTTIKQAVKLNHPFLAFWQRSRHTHNLLESPVLKGYHVYETAAYGDCSALVLGITGIPAAE